MSNAQYIIISNSKDLTKGKNVFGQKIDLSHFKGWVEHDGSLNNSAPFFCILYAVCFCVYRLQKNINFRGKRWLLLYVPRAQSSAYFTAGSVCGYWRNQQTKSRQGGKNRPNGIKRWHGNTVTCTREDIGGLATGVQKINGKMQLKDTSMCSFFIIHIFHKCEHSINSWISTLFFPHKTFIPSPLFLECPCAGVKSGDW